MTKQLRLVPGPAPNSFGHDRRNPRLELVRKIPEHMPPFIYKAMAAVDRIFHHPKEFRELTKSIDRRRRTERLEAIVLLLKAEILRTDLAALVIGQGAGDGEHVGGISVRQLAEWCGLRAPCKPRHPGRERKREHLSPRTERAFGDLMRAGWQLGKRDSAGRLCPYQFREQEVDPVTGESRWRGHPAIRRWNPLFFHRLGLKVELELAQAKARAKRSTARADARAAAAAAAAAEISAELRIPKIRDAPRGGPPLELGRPAAPPATSEETARRLVELQLRARLAHPEWSADAIRAEARRQLGQTGPPE